RRFPQRAKNGDKVTKKDVSIKKKKPKPKEKRNKDIILKESLAEGDIIELEEISDTIIKSKPSLCDNCIARETINKETQTEKKVFIETMVQTSSDYSDFDITKYHNVIRDIINRKVKSKTWSFIQEFSNNSRKLDPVFSKTNPEHILFTKFKKLN